VFARWFVPIAIAFCFVLPLQAADHSVGPIISHIPREPVESSAVAAIGYSKRLHALEIEFRDRLIYRYLEVPMAIYQQLMSADSKARYYNHNIRGKYHCLRVKQPRER
jgi:hypothetical protein